MRGMRMAAGSAVPAARSVAQGWWRVDMLLNTLILGFSLADSG
ncbi:MAG TPA: hypothetical protein VFL51_06385 [Pseudolabrys sp.]|nr:hypothetical protein [Pseudolabrys sp.]